MKKIKVYLLGLLMFCSIAVFAKTDELRKSNLSNLPCSETEIELRILVVAATKDDPALQSIQQILDYTGTLYDVHIATKNPNGLTYDKLAKNCRGYYRG